jgi:uncharacterized phage-associated protein
MPEMGVVPKWGGVETCCKVHQNGVYLQRRMIRFQFNSIKTTQAAAFLLERHNGSMSKGVLIKLLYLADRELLSRRGQPLTGDQPVSMENGPVLSKTYDLTKGAALEHRAYWEQHISVAKKGDYLVSLKKKTGTEHLSKGEIRTLEAVDNKFGNWSWRRLVDYCHTLPEWKNPGKSSSSIQVEAILTAVGKSAHEISEIQGHAMESAWLDLVLCNQATG